jgi:hypothetical protein
MWDHVMEKVLATTPALVLFAASVTCANAQSKPDSVTFSLKANPPFVKCLSADSPTEPQATVKVVRGELNDVLRITVTGLKPGLAFDLFTVQRSPFEPDGSAVQTFPGFGLAWYQTDLQADESGKASARIRTILLDQIFGFDSDIRAAAVLSWLRPTPSM